MLTQNKKIITFATITLLIIVIILVFLGWMIRYLTKGLDTVLNYKGLTSEVIQNFNFKSLQDIGIKEINNLLIATPTSTLIISTSTTSTSTNSTSTSASSTNH